MPDPARENAALEAGHQAIHQKYGTVCRDDSGKVCPILDDVKVIAAGVQAALAELANQWDDLLTSQSEIMTTPQRNAMRNAVTELRLALGQSSPVAAREPCGDPYSGIGCVNPDCTHDGPWVPAPVATSTAKNPFLPDKPADGQHSFEGPTDLGGNNRCKFCGAYERSDEGKTNCEGQFKHSGKLQSMAARRWAMEAQR